MGKILLEAICARLDALESAQFGGPRRRLSKAELARREGCSTREVMRRVHVKDGRLPPPDDVIRGRLFWWSDSVERHQRQRAQADTPEAKAARDPRRLRKPKPATTELREMK